ncbi:MAG: Gfo/Idh/MocA family oxidoreductase [Alphaproteobacteria bacterium]|nr:Gfo/Idh/MocA family oxidoreductase [Alphaproteobacteria bacterium]
MTAFGFGIVGTGMVAKAIADAIQAAANARLAAVSSRSQATAEAFAAGRPGTEAVEGRAALLARDDVDAVYVAIPTAAKEEAALAAIAAGKHVLVDKPFVDAQSVDRIARAAAAANLVFMDATHFVHHPRRAAVRATLAERVGKPRVMHSVFYTGLKDRSNIRYDPAREPMGALGDLGWYCTRAMVEYLRPRGAVAQAEAVCQRDPETHAVTQVSGLLAFESGENATFGAGFESGTTVNELGLVGDKGVIVLDDFAMNWTNSFGFQAAEVPTGYVHRSGSMTPDDFTFVETPSGTPQQVLMIQNFADLATSGDRETRVAYAKAAATTQHYLDAVWAKIAGR